MALLSKEELDECMAALDRAKNLRDHTFDMKFLRRELLHDGLDTDTIHVNNLTEKEKIFVRKRSGYLEKVQFDKITERLHRLCKGLDTEYLDIPGVSKKVIDGLYCGVTTTELDSLAAEICASMITKHYDYGSLAARILISNHQKESSDCFSDVMLELYNYIDSRSKKYTPMISDELINFILDNKKQLNAAIDYKRDFNYTYFGFKTLYRSYLLRKNNVVLERPQHLIMRVSCGIHYKNSVEAVIESYKLMSEMWFTHASPTMFNAATPKPQMSSCFLLSMTEDSIEGIYDTLKQCALISKSAGGIGVAIHCIRSFGSYIAGTNGTSNGIVPMLRVYNNTARYVDQGGNKRPGAFAMYLEPWHPDIIPFLELKRNTGAEEIRARDLFYGLWIPDLFMKRVKDNDVWSLMDPNDCPGLFDSWGLDFELLYEKYEREGKFRSQVNAQDLWYNIIESQIETGTPYMMYKDACNLKSNQKNLGTIKCSNLCTEIVEFSSPEEIAVCNLASISLTRFVNEETKTFNFEKLIEVTKAVTKNLNCIIDNNYYPVKEAKRSNMRHRPIGIGVQGLADAFFKMSFAFESQEAKHLNRKIFEYMYYGALEASCELAEKDGTYETYAGSPISKGVLQPDMWGVMDFDVDLKWDDLRARIKKFGVRNSLLLAPMPTASTAQIMGNTESFEPITSNVYQRRVLSGEFQVVNKYLLKELIKLDLWSDELKTAIVTNGGSIQSIEGIPIWIKNVFKTVWEISQKTIIDLAADRGAFIDQSQSLNLHLSEPNYGKITSMHFYSWEKGLKTGMYYLRTKPACAPIKFTVSKSQVNILPGEYEQLIEKLEETGGASAEAIKHMNERVMACSLNNPESCESCQG